MNVDDYGIMSILLTALLVAAAVVPCLLVVWFDQTGQSAMKLVPARIGSSRVLTPQDRLTSPDVLPANQAWRAPPTFVASPQLHQPGDRSRWI